MENSPVLLAICTWNRCGLLAETLDSLCGQVFPSAWTVIVIDNNSSDETPAVAAHFARHLPLRRTVELQQGLSHARNCALAEAAKGGGQWVLFADDDVQFEQGYLQAWLGAISSAEPEVGFLGGGVVPWFPKKPSAALAAGVPAVRNGFCGLDAGDPRVPINIADRLPVGANFAVRTSIAQPLGFDSRLGHTGKSTVGGEEHDLFRRMCAQGYCGRWALGAVVRHWVDPARFRLKYLVPYLVNSGRTEVRAGMVAPGRTVAGVPGWILKDFAGFAAGLLAAAVTRQPTAAYRNLSGVCVRGGMLWEATIAGRAERDRAAK